MRFAGVDLHGRTRVRALDELAAVEVDRRVDAERGEEVDRGGEADLGVGETGAHQAHAGVERVLAEAA